MKPFGLAIAAVLILPHGALAQSGEQRQTAAPSELAAPLGQNPPQLNESLVDPEQIRSQSGPASDRSTARPLDSAPQNEASVATDPAMAEADTQATDASGTAVASQAAAPEPDPEPSPDPAIEACLSLGPVPSAGVPAGAAQAQAAREALAAAAQDCTAAAALDDAPPEVLFLAAEIAQGRRDVARAFDLLTRATQQAFGPAETRIGDYHLFGLAPGGEDVDAAIAHYEAAAALGDAPGMTTLALMHRVGRGVPRDTARMVALLEEAADAGYHFAQYRLAQTYLTGEGIPGRSDPALGIPDPGRAATLYTRAAEAGNITAALELAALYGDPASGLPENPREQARLTRMASRAGLPEATAALALLYETGRGVDQSPGIAAGLYVKALESGKISFDSLRKGAPGPWDFDTAVAFQTILQERGLYAGPLDGLIGPGSAAGARALAGN